MQLPADPSRPHPVSLDRLTAALAHAIRNPLAGATASLELLARRFDAGTEEHERCERAFEELGRISTCVSELVELAAPPQGTPRAVALGPWLRARAPRWTERAERAGVTLAVEAKEELAPAHADPDALGRAVDRLLETTLEAADSAMRIEATGERGRLHVSITPFRPAEERDLGLKVALARAAIGAWGGSLVLDDARATIVLPEAVA